ncbi:25850_t:CDS:2 [Gigaspora rosea]|nr:25850_t:CDS:2 [Gigaspora rosea]
MNAKICQIFAFNFSIADLNDYNAKSDRKKVVQNKILVSSKSLSKLESQKNIQQNYRDQKRQKLQQVKDQLKAAGINTQLIKPVGHPCLEEAQLTLDQLYAALEQIIYKISHLATYLRLLPKRFNTEEEKQHTRIPFGLAASNKQAPILMRVEYKMELLDHDWIITKKHKLIPFVYVILEIQSAGIILPYDTFGPHLNDQLKTAIDELEKRNFKVAGEILAFV